ncbi:MAG: hypothetical protein M1546_20470 [Chloroflexi bacterium]|nr:hypothetical protein [Chloroflexota bacterium]
MLHDMLPSSRQRLVVLRNVVMCLGLVWLMTACTPMQGAVPASALSTQVTPLTTLPAATAILTATPSVLKLLKVQPETGRAGDSFTITGEGLPPGKEVEFTWATVDGNYITQVSAENVEFREKKYTEKQISLGRATVDAQGRVAHTSTVPEDYGELHDIFAIVDGQPVAKSGFRIKRHVTITPQEGPLGTPITIEVTGLGWRPFESTIAVRYDNHPVGIITAVTTKGTALAVIRAAGRTGKHIIDINHGARSVPYLNNQQSGTAHIPDWHFEFTVTSDSEIPPFTLDWPDAARVGKASDAVPRTAGSGLVNSAIQASMEPDSGPILSQSRLHASDLPLSAEVELFWVSVRGNRVSPSGWSLTEVSLLKTTTDQNGSLNVGLQIPDDLGGWHIIKLVQGEKVLAEVPYYVERSLVDVTPRQVKSGEVFTVHIKGVGWTELDNGVAVTYDNAYIGFACGFNSNGDVTINLVATGGPGIHLIDLYPMIYQGHGQPPWGYQQSYLTFQQDFPGLALGYKLPAFRLAIEVK